MLFIEYNLTAWILITLYRIYRINCILLAEIQAGQIQAVFCFAKCQPEFELKNHFFAYHWLSQMSAWIGIEESSHCLPFA